MNKKSKTGWSILEQSDMEFANKKAEEAFLKNGANEICVAVFYSRNENKNTGKPSVNKHATIYGRKPSYNKKYEPNKYVFTDFISTISDCIALAQSFENHSGEFYQEIDLVQAALSDVIRSKYGYCNLDFRNINDNIRRSAEKFLHGEGKAKNIMKDYYVALIPKISEEEEPINNPSEEVKYRHEHNIKVVAENNTPKICRCPLTYDLDNNGVPLNPYIRNMYENNQYYGHSTVV